MTVTFTVAPPAPVIVLAPTSGTFTSTQGGANPASQSITITNGGGGTLSGLSVGTISYGVGATGWLQPPTLNTTTAPATLTVQPVTGGLTVGTYTATIPLQSAVASNSPQTLTVTFTVTAPTLPPAISLSATGRTFSATQGGANPASQAVTIANAGGGTLSGLSVGAVTYGAGATGWLQTPTLNTTTAPATLTVQPVTGSLTVGTYTATISVLSPVATNSPRSLTVTFTVAAAATSIVLAPTSRAFAATQGGANPASQTIAITNGGGGTLSGLGVGTISYGAGASAWLQTSTLSTTTAPATLTVQPVTGGLTAGTYTATIPLQSSAASNSPQSVTVTFAVAAPLPSIVLAPTSRAFTATQGGANPASQTIAITNGGGGTLSGLSVGTISYGTGASAWLQAPTLSTATAPATLTVQPLTGTLTTGTYTATIPLQSAVAGNSPQSVTVTFTVAAAPTSIVLAPTSRAFTATQGGINPASQIIAITNGGGGTLNGLSVGTISYGTGASAWLQTPTLSSITAPATLTVQPVTGSLTAGIYTATIPLQSSAASNSPQSVTVTFTVAAPVASIVLAPTSRAFTATQGGINPASQTIAITNGATGTLTGLSVGTITYGAGGGAWLQAPTLNTTTAPATLTIQPVTGSLLAGTYTATIPLLSNAATNSPQSLTVTFTVAVPPATIALSASALNYAATQGGSNPFAQTVSITNSGTGTLSALSVGTISYSAGATSWIQSATLSSTTAPATLTVQLSTASLAPGTYTATVPVQTLGASNSPRNIAVTLNVYSLAQQVVISGTAEFESVPTVPVVGRLNYAGASFNPIRAATVEITSASSGLVLASGVTSATGTYSLPIPITQPVIVSLRAEMKRIATLGGQWNFGVRNNTAGDSMYVLDSAVVSPSGAGLTYNIRAASGWSVASSSYTAPRAAAPFAILDVVYQATQKILSVSPNANFPALNLFWSINNKPVAGNIAAGEITTSNYAGSGGGIHRLYILGAVDDDTDEYDTHVVAHEWGHYFQAAFSFDDSPGSDHRVGDRLDMRLAFSEGWGNAWSGIALGSPIYTDSVGLGQQLGGGFDVSEPPVSNRGWYSEQSVQYLLWSFQADSTIGFAPIFNVMTGALKPPGALTSIHSFSHQLKAAVPGRAAAIDALLSGQQIIVQDAFGTGETNNGGVPIALPIYKTHTAALGVSQNYCVTDDARTPGDDENNKLGANVYVLVTLAASGLRTITATSTNGTASSDPDFIVRRADGTASRFQIGITTSETATLSLPAGTHMVLLYDFALTRAQFSSTGTRCFNLTVQ